MVHNITKMILNYPIMALYTLMPLLVIFTVWHKKIPLKSHLDKVMWFSVFFFFSDLPLWITAGLNIHNMMYYYIRDLWVHMLIIGIYYFVLDSPVKKRIIILIEIILLLIGILSILVSKDVPAELSSIYKLAVILAIFMHFHSIISELKITSLLNYPFFWISSGALIFSCGSIFIMLFYKYTINIQTPKIFIIYTHFLDIMGILMFIFIEIGFLSAKKKYL